MRVIVDIAIVPIGVGLSLSAYVAACERVFTEAGLDPTLHANGTNIEGEWDEVMAVIRACRVRMLENSNRISIGIRIDERKGVTDGIRKKVASAKAKMNAASAELGIRNAERDELGARNRERRTEEVVPSTKNAREGRR